MKIIYKITNMVNGKIYIGKTTKTIKRRFYEHCREASEYKKCLLEGIKFRYKSRLYPAMAEYGIENFKIELLENCSEELNLEEREMYYIHLWNSQDPDIGYNISPGGNGGPLFKGHHYTKQSKLKQSMTQQGKKWYNNGIVEIMVLKEQEIPEGFILGRLKGQGFASGAQNPAYGKPGTNKGKHMSDIAKHKLSASLKARYKNKHLVWYNNGIIEHEFDPNTECIPENFIKGRLKVQSKNWRPVNMYNLEGQFLATFNSMSEAERATGVSVGSILACCMGRTHKAGKYIWKYKNL